MLSDGRLAEQSQCMQAVSEIPTTQIMYFADQALWIFPAQNDRGEANICDIYKVSFLLSRHWVGTQSLCLGNSPCYADHKLWGGLVSREHPWRGSFFQVTQYYRPENESPARCCGFSFGFLHDLDCTEPGSGIWYMNKEEHWKALVSNAIWNSAGSHHGCLLAHWYTHILIIL